MSDKKTDQDEPAFFVSRRGRQVGINQVDLKGIDVDDQPTPKKAPNAPDKKPVKKEKKQRGSWSRRKKAIIMVVILTILLVPIVAFELVALQYKAAITEAKSDFDRIVSSTVLPAQKKPTISADQLRNIANEVDAIVGSMCRGGMLDNIASLYPRASAALNDCKGSQTEYASLVSSLRDLEKETRYLERVDIALKPATTPITDEYAVIAAQQTVWRDAAEALDKLSPSDLMRTAHRTVSGHVKSIAENWSKLNQANNDQDAVAFMDAEKALATEYEALRSASSGFEQVLATVQSRLSEHYDALK